MVAAVAAGLTALVVAAVTGLTALVLAAAGIEVAGPTVPVAAAAVEAGAAGSQSVWDLA